MTPLSGYRGARVAAWLADCGLCLPRDNPRGHQAQDLYGSLRPDATGGYRDSCGLRAELRTLWAPVSIVQNFEH